MCVLAVQTAGKSRFESDMQIGFESLQIANVNTADKIHEYVSNAINNVKNIPAALSFLNRYHFSVNKLLHTVKTEFPEDFYPVFYLGLGSTVGI